MRNAIGWGESSSGASGCFPESDGMLKRWDQKYKKNGRLVLSPGFGFILGIGNRRRAEGITACWAVASITRVYTQNQVCL